MGTEVRRLLCRTRSRRDRSPAAGKCWFRVGSGHLDKILTLKASGSIVWWDKDGYELRAAKEAESKSRGHLGAVRVHVPRQSQDFRVAGAHRAVEVWALAVGEGHAVLAGERKLVPWLLTKGGWEILQSVGGQIELTEVAQVSNLRGYGV